ncbi:hypothetical protein BT69DRAFT_1218021 [Atractiella rhizophila]|nr:hypothetical protein BT69DRAFT_1218021 [Atractiella rhizophila]
MDNIEKEELAIEDERSSWGYWLIKQLFKCLIKTIYNDVVIEGLEYLPKDGEACIICANHGNSLTDPAVLLSHIPSAKRSLIRLTAKDTHFNQNTVASFLIRQSGAVPIMRPKDHLEKPEFVKEGNIQTFSKLIQALQKGACVLLFPEGISRYHPSISPLRTGAARIALTALSTAPTDTSEPFTLTVLPVTLTYLHRFHFRSNVLVRFSPPIVLSSQTPESNLPTVSQLTAEVEHRLKRAGIDAPSWKEVRRAHTARRVWAPCNAAGDGKITLGEYVRLTQLFVQLLEQKEEEGEARIEFKMKLKEDIDSYATALRVVGIKDNRLATQSQLGSAVLIYRLSLRILWALCLAVLAAPGLLVASPVLAISKRAERRFKSTDKPLWDVLDEVMQTKALTGWLSFLAVYSVLLLLTAPFAIVTTWAIPMWLWLTLRWSQDLPPYVPPGPFLVFSGSVGETKGPSNACYFSGATYTIASSLC